MSERKLVLVTGSTDGIGRATAFELASRGARVIVHGRDADKVRRVAGDLGEEHEWLVADYLSLADTRRAADELMERFDRLDVLINNAGTYQPRRSITTDGCEATWQVNHLAPFLLTTRLLPLLAHSVPSRVITLTAGAYAHGHLDLLGSKPDEEYDAYQAYCDSKLASVLFCYALARRVAASGVASLCIDPGATATKMLAAVHPDYAGRPAEETAAELADLALAESDGVENGGFYRQGAKRHTVRASYDEVKQDALWDASERLVAAR